jgi:zinc D-Ala-D-Ala dipeptidase
VAPGGAIAAFCPDDGPHEVIHPRSLTGAKPTRAALLWTFGGDDTMQLILGLVFCCTFAIVRACFAGCITTPPGDLVYLRDVDPSIVQDIRYARSHNFVGRAISGYDAAQCLLTLKAATALQSVQKRVLQRGYSLKVYDCYRPDRAVRHFVQWAKGDEDHATKAEFYPRLAKNQLIALGYIAAHSAHSRASTVDIAIISTRSSSQALASQSSASQSSSSQSSSSQSSSSQFSDFKSSDFKSAGHEDGPQRACNSPYRVLDDNIDLGTNYDCLDELSHTRNPLVSTEARMNRQFLVSAMLKGGFRNYRAEWWHFTLSEEPYPNTCFDFPITAHPSPPG